MYCALRIAYSRRSHLKLSESYFDWCITYRGCSDSYFFTEIGENHFKTVLSSVSHFNDKTYIHANKIEIRGTSAPFRAYSQARLHIAMLRIPIPMLQEQGFSELDGKMLVCRLRDVQRARESTWDNWENSLLKLLLTTYYLNIKPLFPELTMTVLLQGGRLLPCPFYFNKLHRPAFERHHVRETRQRT